LTRDHAETEVRDMLAGPAGIADALTGFAVRARPALRASRGNELAGQEHRCPHRPRNQHRKQQGLDLPGWKVGEEEVSRGKEGGKSRDDAKNEVRFGFYGSLLRRNG